MGYKNPKELLTAATALPAAIEAKLPAGAPKISTMLLDATAKMPDLPDFPMELPGLPAIPEFPAMPAMPGAPAELARSYVTGVEVRPVAPTPVPQGRREIIPSPAVGVIPEVRTRRGL